MILYIANRGEIARRIIKTASRMGFTTAVGYSDGDRDLPFVEEADLKVSLGGIDAAQTYLHQDKVIEAAKSLGADYLHPAYGFLSENADFVERLQKENIKFVGPSAEAMRLLGDKIESRAFLKKIGIPLLPSYDGEDQSDDQLSEQAEALGFPLLIKPAAGGGGKGMFVARSPDEFFDRLQSSKRIAQSAFGDDRVFLERFIERARHVEVQVLADSHGNVQTLGERECSIQRNHQKLIEETPCADLPEAVRERLLQDSKKLAEEAKYVSAGTIEWIWDGAEGLYFLEVNTRLQVEHPVTEEVWGVDLVEEQLKIAQGESIKDLQLQPRVHAIEARLCAEDPSQDFLPSSGRIERLKLPQGVRNDFGFKERSVVSPDFDSMLGKMIALGETREEAIDRLKRALEDTVLFGPVTNRGYLLQILEDADFRAGKVFTRFLEDRPYRLNIKKAFQFLMERKKAQIPSSAIERDDDRYSPWGDDVSTSEIFYEDFGERRFFRTSFADWVSERPKKTASLQEKAGPTAFSHLIRCPLPGKVVGIEKKKGDRVKTGETLVVVEAMKMEHQLKADYSTTIKSVAVEVGERVRGDQVLMELEEETT